VVISSSSTGIGGAGLVSMTGVSIPQPEGTPFPSASSIRLTGTNVLTDTRSDALGGKIEVKANGPVELRGTTISANVNDLRPQSPDRLEQSGNIEMSMGNFSMQGGRISALSTGSQVGGNVVLAAQGPVTLGDGATISASNTGSANAGNVTINGGSQFLSQNATVTTEASHASGGNIIIKASDSIRLVDSRISTSVLGGPNTSGGNIVLDPAIVTLQNSQVLAQAVQGAGGNISIIAGTFLADQTSLVSASSQFGLSGSVNIQSPLSNLSGTLATLPQRPLQAQQLITQRCAAQGSGHSSSLVVAGRDTLPTEPGGWLMSPLAMITGNEPTPHAHVATNEVFELPQSIEKQARPGSEQRAWSPRGVIERATGCGT
jgi:large exoprotein involved in heme utilization and adhesion